MSGASLMTRFSTILNFIGGGILIGVGFGAVMGALTFIIVLIVESELWLFPASIIAAGFGCIVGAVLGGVIGFVLGTITAIFFYKTISRYYRPLLMMISVIITYFIVSGWVLKWADTLFLPTLTAYPTAIFGAWCLEHWHIANLENANLKD